MLDIWWNKEMFSRRDTVISVACICSSSVVPICITEYQGHWSKQNSKQRQRNVHTPVSRAYLLVQLGLVISTCWQSKQSATFTWVVRTSYEICFWVRNSVSHIAGWTQATGSSVYFEHPNNVWKGAWAKKLSTFFFRLLLLPASWIQIPSSGRTMT